MSIIDTIMWKLELWLIRRKLRSVNKLTSIKDVKYNMVFHSEKGACVFRVLAVIPSLDCIEIADILFDNDGYIITSYYSGYMSFAQLKKCVYICDYEDFIFWR